MRQTRISRRRFLETGALGLLAVAAGCSSDDPGSTAAPPSAGSSLATIPPSPATSAAETTVAATPAVTTAPTTVPAPPLVRVAVAGGGDVDDRVRRAVALAGGLGEIKPGETVFVKPNAVYSAIGTTAIITSAEVLSAVVRLVKELGATVIVGDRSARQITDQDVVLERSGLQAAALAAGADEVYSAPSPAVDPAAWVLTQPPSYEETWSAAGGVLAMRKVLEADHLIDLPVCKNHRYAGFSLSMKNFIGAVGDSARDVMHYTVGDPERLSRDIALLNQIFSPLVSILDATDALVNGGPEGLPNDSVRATYGLVLASRDRVALDAAGLSLIKLALETVSVPTPDQVYQLALSTRAWDYAQIRHASEIGLGVARAGSVELVFDGVDVASEIERIYRA